MDKHAKSKHLNNKEFFVPGQVGIVNGVNGANHSSNHTKSTSVATGKKHFGNSRLIEEDKPAKKEVKVHKPKVGKSRRPSIIRALDRIARHIGKLND